eukprot:Hpha_TRINITY_DN26395_c0_g1::TRINITY_DN26395_c0_g1_i1::g.9453::m.9453
MDRAVKQLLREAGTSRGASSLRSVCVAVPPSLAKRILGSPELQAISAERKDNALVSRTLQSKLKAKHGLFLHRSATQQAELRKYGVALVEEEEDDKERATQ